MKETKVIGRRGAYQKGVARRQEILDRAIEVFADRGADGTSLRTISQAIGVSHAALLHYFDSREQLLVAVYDHAERRRHEEDEQRPEGEGRSAVEDMEHAAALNGTVPGLVQLYASLVATALTNGSGDSRQYFAARFRNGRAGIGEQLAAQQRQGTVRDDIPAVELAAMLIALSDGLQNQWLLEPELELRRLIANFALLIAPPSASA